MSNVRDDYDPSCFGCGVGRTMNGHLCSECLRRRWGTVHFRWESPAYIASMQEAVQRLDEKSAYEIQRRKRAAEREAA